MSVYLDGEEKDKVCSFDWTTGSFLSAPYGPTPAGRARDRATMPPYERAEAEGRIRRVTPELHYEMMRRRKEGEGRCWNSPSDLREDYTEDARHRTVVQYPFNIHGYPLNEIPPRKPTVDTSQDPTQKPPTPPIVRQSPNLISDRPRPTCHKQREVELDLHETNFELKPSECKPNTENIEEKFCSGDHNRDIVWPEDDKGRPILLSTCEGLVNPELKADLKKEPCESRVSGGIPTLKLDGCCTRRSVPHNVEQLKELRKKATWINNTTRQGFDVWDKDSPYYCYEQLGARLRQNIGPSGYSYNFNRLSTAHGEYSAGVFQRRPPVENQYRRRSDEHTKWMELNLVQIAHDKRALAARLRKD